MKILLLLVLVGCAHKLSQKEPFKVGDCVEWTPKKSTLKILEVFDFKEFNLKDRYYYGMLKIKEENLDKVLRVVECDK